MASMIVSRTGSSVVGGASSVMRKGVATPYLRCASCATTCAKRGWLRHSANIRSSCAEDFPARGPENSSPIALSLWPLARLGLAPGGTILGGLPRFLLLACWGFSASGSILGRVCCREETRCGLTSFGEPCALICQQNRTRKKE